MSPAHQQKLDALERALCGHGSRNAVTPEILDPDRHCLSMRDYQRGVPGGAPFSLADRARSIRGSLAKDDVADHRVGDWPNDWDPILTELQAMIVATLLQELAARLAATGDPGGEELAAVTRELADEILASRSPSAPTPPYLPACSTEPRSPSTARRMNGLPEPYDETARRKIVPETLEKRVLAVFSASAPLFRKTLCAVSYAHGLPDYNGHYGIRELCDICAFSVGAVRGSAPRANR